MAGMTSIYLGVSGLQSSQNALNTTAHNLSNVNTKGYVRQQAIFSDKIYHKVGASATSAMQVGQGVTSQATSRVRDILLDVAYRKENSRAGFYDSQYEVVTEIETIIGETEGEQYQKNLENIWNSINEMAKTPDSIVARSELVMYAEEFLNRSQSIYNGLIDYQNNLNEEVRNQVDKINALGDKIDMLNEQIASVEAAGIERANDFRDQRDLALDELSKLANISYEENAFDRVTVKLEGVPFVTEDSVFHMATAELDSDKGSTYLSCVWPHLSNSTQTRDVFFLEEKISTADNNDFGSLKGLLLARGDYVATYQDIPRVDDFDTTTEEGRDEYLNAVAKYDREVAPSSIMSMQAMLDTLVNGVVISINDALSPTIKASFTGIDGTTYDDVDVLDIENSSVGDDGKLPPRELFKRLHTERYTEVKGDDGVTYYVYNKNNIFDKESLYTLGNLEMNKEVADDYSLLPFKTKEDEADMKLGERLLEAWDKPFAELNPDNLTKKTFKQYYHEAIYNIGNRGMLYRTISENQVTATREIDNKRQEIAGVSSDEELTNMIKFQSAYNASSRYINVISEMLEHIIERLGQ